jgi:hypothetical protein
MSVQEQSSTLAPGKHPPNSERYAHIGSARIVELFDSGLSHRKIGKLLGMGSCAVGTRLKSLGKARAPETVTKEQLKEIKADPAWEARPENRGVVALNRIVCRECGELKSEINANGEHSHLRTHKMTADEYESKYHGARLVSFARSADQNRRQGHTKTVEDLMAEFAASYVTPSEMKACRRDPEWEETHGLEDFVVCRLCGFKTRVELLTHLRRHDGCSVGSYHEQFPKAQVMPLRIRLLKNEVQLVRGRKLRDKAALLPQIEREVHALRTELAEVKRRPEGWDGWPAEHRMLGSELLSREGYMSNAELVEKYWRQLPHYGSTREEITSSRAFHRLVNRVRVRVNRPGKTPSPRT